MQIWWIIRWWVYFDEIVDWLGIVVYNRDDFDDDVMVWMFYVIIVWNMLIFVVGERSVF